MKDELSALLEPGETVLELRRLHGSQLILPAFFFIVGTLQFTPLAFAPGTALPGVVAIAYSLFIGTLFFLLYRHGRVALTDRRLVYLQKTPLASITLTGWDASAFDGIMVRNGVLGSFMGYGHLLLTKSGRLVTVIRSVNDVKTLVPRIETELLKKGR